MRKLLQESPLKEALEVLTSTNYPRAVSPQASDPVVASALQHSRNTGYYDFYRSLLKLAEEPQDPRKKLPEPWETLV